MNKDYWLIHEALETFQRIRHWMHPDYYREQVMPTVQKLKDRLAIIETEKFINDKKERYNSFIPNQEKVAHEERIKKLETYEPDTIPNKIIEATSNFGLFTSELKSEYCKTDADAPHRYLKELSQSMGRYVCYCEFWDPNDKK